MSLCILIPALVGLISGVLGYLIGKMNSKNGDSQKLISIQSDLDSCRANSKLLNTKITSLEGDLVNAKANANVQSFAKPLETNASAEVASIPFNADLAFSILGKKWKQDDLKVVEGIGPKIEQLYHNAGIKTWKMLSETSVETSQSILNNAGSTFAIHKPGTWAKQAELAYLGKWQELKDWQESLSGGKE